MIYITCGHEKGIGIEVFLKSFILLPSKDQQAITLICEKESLLETAKFCHIPVRIDEEGSTYICNDQLKTIFVSKKPISTAALEKSLEVITSKDILITMPTSKDQLLLDGNKPAGHTEYFRRYYDKEVCMFFKSNTANVLLLTDHIPLRNVPDIKTEVIKTKSQICVDNYQKYFNPLKKVIFAGINPHAGEGGILGSEDIKITEAIKDMRSGPIEYIGPIPGDSILISNQFCDTTLFVYPYHDQGLAPFKTVFKTVGANISLGLPFLRLSVDHGTAFDLYGKNIADYQGCSYVLKMALDVEKKVNHGEVKE